VHLALHACYCLQGILDAAAAPPVPEDSGQGQQPPVPLPPAPDAAAAAEAQRKAAEAAAARVAYEEDQVGGLVLTHYLTSKFHRGLYTHQNSTRAWESATGSCLAGVILDHC